MIFDVVDGMETIFSSMLATEYPCDEATQTERVVKNLFV